VASHASALRAGFVWLDHAHIEAGLATPSFSEGFAGTGFYRPLMAFSLTVDAALGGQPWLYHTTNLGWHALASVLVVLAARELSLSENAATLAGVLFAVHPITSLTAAAIAFRSEAMITAALLTLCVAHLRQKPVLAALAIVVGAFTKETALALAPLFIVALEIGKLTRNVKLYAAETVALAIGLGMRQLYAPAWPATFPQLDSSQAIGTRLAALAKSAGAFALPLDAGVCDAFPITGLFGVMALLGLAIGVGLVLIARQKGSLGLLLVLALLPSLQLVPTLRWWSPHYLYVPLAFAAMLAAERVDARGKSWFVPALVVAGGLGVISWIDGKRYASDETLWRSEVASLPACREGHFYLGEVERKRERFSEAANAYERALAPYPGMIAFVDVDATLQNLGVARARLGQLDAAERAFESALASTRSELTRRRLRHDLASVALDKKDPEKAIRLLEPDVSRDDAFPESLAVYAKALFLVGRRAEAERARARMKASKIREAD
jgi:hypothetical protein